MGIFSVYNQIMMHQPDKENIIHHPASHLLQTPWRHSDWRTYEQHTSDWWTRYFAIKSTTQWRFMWMTWFSNLLRKSYTWYTSSVALVQDETQPREVHVRCGLRKVPTIHCHQHGHRDEFPIYQIYLGASTTMNSQGGSSISRADCTQHNSPHLKVVRQGALVLQAYASSSPSVGL